MIFVKNMANSNRIMSDDVVIWSMFLFLTNILCLCQFLSFKLIFKLGSIFYAAIAFVLDLHISGHLTLVNLMPHLYLFCVVLLL